jgi:hypothetical protein
MILRLSQKLNSKIKAGSLPTMPLDENPFADWSATLFVAGRTQYLLVSNTKSLYSTLMHAKGITNDKQFVQQVLVGIRDFMTQDGYLSIYERFIAPSSGTVQFAKSLNRSITGSVNEIVELVKRVLNEDDLPPHEVGSHINDLLLSAVAVNSTDKYAKPGEVFRTLVNGTES